MARKLAVDRLLFAPVVLLVGIGMLMIYSASAMQIYLPKAGGPSQPLYFVVKQGIAVLLGAGLTIGAMKVDYRLWNDLRVVRAGLALLVLALVAVLFLGPINGTRRWIDLGPLSIQPSEFGKIGLVVALAALLSRREGELDDVKRTLLPVAGLLALLGGLVLLQPDFGTALSYFAIAAAMLFYAGLRLRWFAGAATLALPALVAYAWSAPYRRARILSFLNPEADIQGTGYQAYQSLIAVGTGGLTGLGLGDGRQKLFFLPYPYTDFIYAIVGEELGLLGSLGLLALFAALAFIGIRIVAGTDDFFVRVATAGICTWILAQAMINIGSVIGMLPVIGVPLPFVSAGGSSLVTTMLAVGVLLSFARAEPTCAAALAARPSRVRGTLARLPIPFARRSTPTS